MSQRLKLSASRRQKLTKTTVANAQPDPDRQTFLWDTELRGFGLRISPSGTKAFVMQRRVGRKERRITIGRVGDMPVAAARNRALSLASQFADGHDPVVEQRKQAARSQTLRAAFEAYIAAPKQRGYGMKKALTVRDIRQQMKRFDDWLEMPVTSLTGDMIRDRHEALAATSPAQANLAFRYLRAALNHVNRDSDTPVLAFNPVSRLSRRNQWAAVGRRERYLTPDQIGPWLNAVRTKTHGLKHDRAIADALQFMLLTGCRKAEALGHASVGYPPLLWDDFDLKVRTVTFRDPKNGRDLVLAIGDRLAGMIESRRGSGLFAVFGDRWGMPSDLRTAISRIEAATGLHITPHDLRRTFISTAEVALGIPTQLVMELTNHVRSAADVHGGYVRFSPDDKRAAMQRIEDFMLKGTTY